MIEIIEPIKWLMPRLKYVSYNEEACSLLCQKAKPEDFSQNQASFKAKMNCEEDYYALMVLFGALVFCFWPRPKWGIIRDNKLWSGSWSLWISLQQAYQRGIPIFDSGYLASISDKDVGIILKGDTGVKIPLFQERVAILRDLGNAVDKQYNGAFKNIFIQNNHDAVQIVRTLAWQMPSVFDDRVQYIGQDICFYKRLQLIPAMIQEEFVPLGYIRTPLKNVDQLTALADYKVPWVLWLNGVLEYDHILMDIIRSEKEIPVLSAMEIEIRCSNIWAVHRMSQILGVDESLIDIYLWKMSQKISSKEPYHHSLSIWY